MNYDVTVTEHYEKTVSIEAESVAEAIQIASLLWNDTDPLLDSPPFKGVQFRCKEGRD